MNGKLNPKPRASRNKRRAQQATPDPRIEDFVPKTPLGKKLWALRKEIEASGVPLLNREELEEEIRSRRGGYFEDE